MRRWTLSVLFLAACGNAHAAEVEIASGPLRAVVRDAPWSITFEQRGGASLRTHPSWAQRARSVRREGDAVVADVEGGLLVRNPFGHRTVRWDEIETITLGRYVLFSNMGSVRLRDGSKVPLFGIQHTESVFNSGDRQAHEILENLNLALEASRA